ncbi:MAG: hypothetical protein WC592_00020 [Candidatus Omnitrophota bacterium]|nr:hypothetical protein [Candidatus Omnitrophota bacterium]
MGSEGKISLKVMNADMVVFAGAVDSIFLQGDTGEFELLPYHYPVLSLLRQGKIIINWSNYIPIRKGVVKFFKNDCVILIDLDD